MMFVRRQQTALFAAALSLAAVIFYGDLQLPLDVAGGAPYVAVVLLGWWLPGRRYILLFALMTSMLIMAGYFLSPPGGVPWIIIVNRLFALFAISVTAAALFLAKNEAWARKRSEARAADADHQLAEALEGLADGVVLYDADERFIVCNSRYRQSRPEISHLLVPGTPFEETLRSVLKIRIGTLEGVDENNFEEWIKRRLHTFRHPGAPEIRRYKDGRWHSVHTYKIRDGGTLIIRSDITEQKQSEEAIREKDKRLQTVIDSIPYMINVKDADRLFLMTNPTHQEFFGYDSDDLIGSRRGVIHGKDRDMIKKLDQSVLQNGETITFEVVRRNATGEERNLLATKAALKNSSGEITGLVTSSIDITERKQAEQEIVKARDELEEKIAERTRELTDEVEERKRIEQDLLDAKEVAEFSDRAKSEFLANMSHELRTPLNSIIGFSDMLRNEVLGSVGNPKYMEYLHDINASGRHLLELIKDILDVSKIEAGAMDITDEQVDMAACVETSVKIIGERAKAARVEVSAELSPALPFLRGDSLRIRQILLNLIGNAVKFTEPGGRVVVRAGMKDSAMVLVIEDNGIGIAAKDLAHITEPFTQATNSQTRRYEGTGLGLSLVKSLMELHDGTLAIDSELGNGTTVTVSFPAARTLSN